ncbi:hypothetical protein C8R47DRAFT_589139 [Mycena vitilis]|nr:hypothetical protein C8R47DRAFT_589139 [Mycena vitilis]
MHWDETWCGAVPRSARPRSAAAQRARPPPSPVSGVLLTLSVDDCLPEQLVGVPAKLSDALKSVLRQEEAYRVAPSALPAHLVTVRATRCSPPSLCFLFRRFALVGLVCRPHPRLHARTCADELRICAVVHARPALDRPSCPLIPKRETALRVSLRVRPAGLPRPAVQRSSFARPTATATAPRSSVCIQTQYGARSWIGRGIWIAACISAL